MSSPIHLDEDIDPALIYAPPWARERVPAEIAGRPAALLSETDERNRNATTLDPEFSGDRAMLELQRQLAINPNLIPEPPAETGSAVWPILIRLCGVISFAAFVAWGMASYHGIEKPVGIRASRGFHATYGGRAAGGGRGYHECTAQRSSYHAITCCSCCGCGCPFTYCVCQRDCRHADAGANNCTSAGATGVAIRQSCDSSARQRRARNVGQARQRIHRQRRSRCRTAPPAARRRSRQRRGGSCIRRDFRSGRDAAPRCNRDPAGYRASAAMVPARRGAWLQRRIAATGRA